MYLVWQPLFLYNVAKGVENVNQTMLEAYFERLKMAKTDEGGNEAVIVLS